jgi:RecB family exonuclease
VPRAAFARLCASLAASCPQPAPPPATDAVRIRIPDEAAVLDCDHLFVIGLGEGSFPDLSGPPSALDDADRDRLRAGGAELPSPDDRLAAEMLLFARLVARPRRTLTLSRPAVDPHGQPLLPSSFLVAAEACFAPDAIPTTRQRMPIDGYAEGPAFAAAEHRVQTARSLAARPADRDPWASADDLTDNLRAAKRTADARFRGRAFGPFDGLLRHPPLVREVADRFGPAKVFSPTALEAYVACPFRFWLEHVLRLEPLEDPGEEVEHTRRGAAVHRALARFHKRIRDEAPHLLAGDALPAELGPQLEADLLAAVQEYADRAPGRTAKVLWELEGRRLLRSVRRYRGHWDGFRGPWRKDGACPTPHAFESNFGVPGEPGAETPNPLVISVGGVEVRIGGVIDRIDAAEVAGEVGFWIIDYKTGRGEHYTGRDLEQFEKLQLPLYAIAVERVLFAGRPARPLGLAYWLVAGDGPKPVLPDRRRERAWLADPAGWAAFRSQLEAWVATIVSHIRSGDFPLAPRSETCTDTCSFGPVCRISQARAVGKVFPIGLPVVANPAA